MALGELAAHFVLRWHGSRARASYLTRHQRHPVSNVARP